MEKSKIMEHTLYRLGVAGNKKNKNKWHKINGCTTIIDNSAIALTNIETRTNEENLKIYELCGNCFGINSHFHNKILKK